MKTDTSEKGLESLIVAAMTGENADAVVESDIVKESSTYGGAGWIAGHPEDFDREYAIDLVQLRGFIMATQKTIAEAINIDHLGPTRQKFLVRLQGEISKRGVIDVLRNGVKHGPHSIQLFYGTPSAGNVKAIELFEYNRFS